jgi:hypothetical protein
VKVAIEVAKAADNSYASNYSTVSAEGDDMSTPALGQVDEVQVIAADGTTATVCSR